MSILKKIDQKLASLSAGQKKVAQYVLDKFELFSYATLAQLSSEIGVSETTIIRFSYALGFDKFSTLQDAVRREILKISNNVEFNNDDLNSYQKIYQSEAQSLLNASNKINWHDVDLIVEDLSKAKQVLCVGARSTYHVVLWFANLLNDFIGNAICVREFYDSDHHVIDDPKDKVIFVISLSRYAKWTCDYIKKAKIRGYKVIALMDDISCPIATICDRKVVLPFAKSNFGFNSYVHIHCFLSSILVSINEKNANKTTKRLSALEELYKDFELFYE